MQSPLCSPSCIAHPSPNSCSHNLMSSVCCLNATLGKAALPARAPWLSSSPPSPEQLERVRFPSLSSDNGSACVRPVKSRCIDTAQPTYHGSMPEACQDICSLSFGQYGESILALPQSSQPLWSSLQPLAQCCLLTVGGGFMAPLSSSSQATSIHDTLEYLSIAAMMKRTQQAGVRA